MAQTFNKKDLRKYSEKYTNIKGAQEPSNNFKDEVIVEPTVRDAFEQFTNDYSETRRWNPPDQFAVSESSQKEAKKFVKSVIKLDKNFHIYVHGNKDRIERGFDDKRKLNYYTLWFDAEV